MNPVQSTLQELPQQLRKALYVTLVLIGASLTALQTGGVTDLGPLTVTDALKTYAALTPLIGVLAVANVSKPRESDLADAGSLGDVAGDIDLSSFQPVGHPDDVYGRDGW